MGEQPRRGQQADTGPVLELQIRPRTRGHEELQEMAGLAEGEDSERAISGGDCKHHIQSGHCGPDVLQSGTHRKDQKATEHHRSVQSAAGDEAVQTEPQPAFGAVIISFTLSVRTQSIAAPPISIPPIAAAARHGSG